MSKEVYNGIEVVPGSDLPEVVEEPPKAEKPYDGTTQYMYEQQQQQSQPYLGVYQDYNAHPHGAGYAPTGYSPTTQPSLPAQSYYGSSQSGAHVIDGSPPGGSPPQKGMIFGLPRRKFWWIFGPLIALLVIGLAVGLGAGLGTSHKSSSDSTDPKVAPSSCPDSNGTTYQSTDSNSFLILCDVDYSNGATTDISHYETDTFEACIGLCSNDTSCAGAGWGNNGESTCWMKGALGYSHSTLPTHWWFAIKQ